MSFCWPLIDNMNTCEPANAYKPIRKLKNVILEAFDKYL